MSKYKHPRHPRATRKDRIQWMRRRNRLNINKTITIANTSDDGQEIDGTTWTSTPGANIMAFGYNNFVAVTSVQAAISFDTQGQVQREARIGTATLRVYVVATFESAGIDFDIKGELNPSASQPSASNRPSSWASTVAEVNRTDAPPIGAYLDIDVTAIVQEIIDQPGWDEGRINIFTESNIFSGQNNWTVRDIQAGSDPAQLIIQS